jgi:hypothetical protein
MVAKVMVHVASVLIGDVTPFGVVESVVSTRNNIKTTITFVGGKKKRFPRFAEIEVEVSE